MVPTKRLLLKLSGERFGGEKKTGIDPEAADRFAQEILPLQTAGWEIVIVVGGGNFFRGRTRPTSVAERTAHRMGMLGSVMTAMAFRDVLNAHTPARVLSGVPVPTFVEQYRPEAGEEALAAGQIVIIGGGTGQPGFSTDTGAALIARDLSCSLLLKGTDVDGVYDKDPHKFTDAKRYEKITYDEAIAQKLGVMDMASFALCRERDIPMIVFDVTQSGNILAAAEGRVGTRVSSSV